MKSDYENKEDETKELYDHHYIFLEDLIISETEISESEHETAINFLTKINFSLENPEEILMVGQSSHFYRLLIELIRELKKS